MGESWHPVMTDNQPHSGIFSQSAREWLPVYLSCIKHNPNLILFLSQWIHTSAKYRLSPYSCTIGPYLMESGKQVETVCLLSKLSEAKNHITVKLDMEEMDMSAAESKATYLSESDGVLDSGSDCTCYCFYCCHFGICRTGILSRRQTNPEMQTGGGIAKR